MTLAALGAVAAMHVVDGVVHLVADGVPYACWKRCRWSRRSGSRRSRPPTGNATDVLAAMPGMIAQMLVELGQAVQPGDVVVVLEAMKLMMPLAAKTAGRVRAIHGGVGQDRHRRRRSRGDRARRRDKPTYG